MNSDTLEPLVQAEHILENRLYELAREDAPESIWNMMYSAKHYIDDQIADYFRSAAPVTQPSGGLAFLFMLLTLLNTGNPRVNVADKQD